MQTRNPKRQRGTYWDTFSFLAIASRLAMEACIVLGFHNRISFFAFS